MLKLLRNSWLKLRLIGQQYFLLGSGGFGNIAKGVGSRESGVGSRESGIGSRNPPLTPPRRGTGIGSRESGAVRPVANLIRLRKAHRGSRESGERDGIIFWCYEKSAILIINCLAYGRVQ
ncbi:MAG: hypothetical protein F6K26_41530 [Moorea sp. SIO2I5]|nr:hypothetical protein [Moorena sp. SIO2I5]